MSRPMNRPMWRPTRTVSVYINRKDVPVLLGKGGRTLKKIESRTGTKLQIRDGTGEMTSVVMIRGPDEDSINAARSFIAHHTTRSSMFPRLSSIIIDGHFADEDIIHFEPIEEKEGHSNIHAIGSQAYKITRVEAISGQAVFTEKEEEEENEEEDERKILEEFLEEKSSSVLAALENRSTVFGTRELIPLVARGLKNEIRTLAMGQESQCIIISVRFGAQHLLDLPVNAESTTISRWRTEKSGRGGVRLSFCNGLTRKEVNVLREFLLKEGFDRLTKNGSEKRCATLSLNVLKSFGRAHASLSWDELKEKWKLRKLVNASNRVAIATFMQPSKSQHDFRIIVESRKKELLEKEEVNKYLQAQQDGYDKDIRFVSTEEVNLTCVRYKTKERFSNGEFKVAITEVEQDDIGSKHTQTEVKLTHVYWNDLKHLTSSQESYLSDLARSTDKAISKIEETIEFARKIACVVDGGQVFLALSDLFR